MKSKSLKNHIIMLNLITALREFNLFKIRFLLTEKYNQKIKEPSTDSKNGLSFKVKKNAEQNQLYDIKNI